MTPDLKPCPFCGKRAQEWTEGPGYPEQWHTIRCSDTACMNRTAPWDTMPQAIAAWNRRSPCPDCRTAKAEAIREVADDYRRVFSSSAELRAQGVVADLDARAAALSLSPAPASEEGEEKPTALQNLYARAREWEAWKSGQAGPDDAVEIALSEAIAEVGSQENR